MISHPELSLDSKEFVNDPENYFKKILLPRLEQSMGIKFTPADVASFLEPLPEFNREDM